MPVRTVSATDRNSALISGQMALAGLQAPVQPRQKRRCRDGRNKEDEKRAEHRRGMVLLDRAAPHGGIPGDDGFREFFHNPFMGASEYDGPGMDLKKLYEESGGTPVIEAHEITVLPTSRPVYFVGWGQI